MQLVRTRTLVIALVLVLSLVGCVRRPEAVATTPRDQLAREDVPAATTGPATATPVATPPDEPSPTPAAVPTDTPPLVATATPTAATSAATPTAAAATDAVEAAIKAVIQKANDAQARAFAQNDPTLMRDTAMPSYYAHLTQINRELADNGVSAIKLLKLDWGPIVLQNPTTAIATTFEDWQTTYTDGTTEESRDRNVYTLVRVGQEWRIQDDAHPDSEGDQPPPETSPAPTPSTPQPPAVNVPAGSGRSRNWSGYAATGGTFTAVSGTWTVPQPTGSRATASGATWVGIGGVRSRDLIQAGTEENVLGSGQVRYSAWIETLPQPSHRVPLRVNPGDSVTVTISQQTDGRWLISMKNNTTGQSYQTTEQYNSSLSSAEWIEEAPSGGRRVLPLENFGTVQFTAASATKDGKKVNLTQAGARPITMIDGNGNALAVPSTLGSDGASFSITRTAGNPSVPTPGGVGGVGATSASWAPTGEGVAESVIGFWGGWPEAGQSRLAVGAALRDGAALQTFPATGANS